LKEADNSDTLWLGSTSRRYKAIRLGAGGETAARDAPSPGWQLEGRVRMRLLAIIGALAILIGVAAAIFFFGGFFSVAGSYDDPPPVAWALVHVRQASIARHAVDTPPQALGDPALIRAGARAFAQRGCVACHGGPGADWAKFSEGMNPGPPDLSEVVDTLEPSQLFWVVKNGIRMTGMPSFGKIGVADSELWSIVAFLKQLPHVSPEDFKAWSQPAP
jgi:mono/diheme cytochrome c family protein